MKKVFLVLALAVILSPTIANAKISFQFKSSKAYINGLPVTLHAPTAISNGAGMIPVRLLLIESGHLLVTGKSENDPELIKTIGKDKVLQGFNYFRNPCFVTDDKGKAIATFGLDSNRIFIGDQPNTTLSAKASIIKGILFVPIKDFCKILGLQLQNENNMLVVTKIPVSPKPKTWADKLLENIDLETLLLVCFGVTVFCVVMLLILTPLRRVR